MKENKIISINEVKQSVENNYDALREKHLKVFLENIDDYIQEKNKENGDEVFEEGFKLGLLCGEFQFYFEKLYDLEVLNKSLTETEIEFVSFFKIQEDKYFGKITSIVTPKVTNNLKTKNLF